MADKLLKRPKRSAMIVTSSVADTIACPCLATYSATKAFASYIAQGLSFELRDQIDVFAYCPGFVSTKLLMRGEENATPWTPSASSAASACFRDIGYGPKTNGSIFHEI